MAMYSVDPGNPWIRDVEAHRRPPRGWLAAIFAAGFSAAILLTAKTWGGTMEEGLAAALGAQPGAWADILASGALQVVIFGSFLLVAVVATRLESRPLWRWVPGAGPWLLAGLAVGSGGFAAAVAVAALAGAVIAVPPLSGPTEPVAIGLGVALVAIQSVGEEAFFRGWLQPILCMRWGAPAGLFAASALFAALHVIAGAHGLMAVVNLFLGGLFFGLLALRTGTLVAPAAAHFAWNWTESGVLGLDPQPTGSLFDLGLAGRKMWSGGADTMNGSLATTLALVVLLAALGSRRPLLGAKPAVSPRA
jgi:membrane protease YdiL (CAAX protease family)